MHNLEIHLLSLLKATLNTSLFLIDTGFNDLIYKDPTTLGFVRQHKSPNSMP